MNERKTRLFLDVFLVVGEDENMQGGLDEDKSARFEFVVTFPRRDELRCFVPNV